MFLNKNCRFCDLKLFELIKTVQRNGSPVFILHYKLVESLILVHSESIYSSECY